MEKEIRWFLRKANRGTLRSGYRGSKKGRFKVPGRDFGFPIWQGHFLGSK